MHLQLDQQIKINATPLVGQISLSPKGVNLLIGPNGIGKTTLFNYLKLNAKDLFQDKKLSFLDQLNLSPISQLTVIDVINCLCEELQSLYPRIDEFYKLLDFFEVSKLLHSPVESLSGGENQLIKTIICLCQKADFYLMDEPFHFLDFKNHDRLMNLIEQRSKDCGFFIIEHRNQKLLEISEKIFELKCGESTIKLGTYNGSN